MQFLARLWPCPPATAATRSVTVKTNPLFLIGGAFAIAFSAALEGAPEGVVVVDSLLIDPTAADPNAPRARTKPAKTSTAARQPRTGKVLERSRWYVPKPLVNLILRASGNR